MRRGASHAGIGLRGAGAVLGALPVALVVLLGIVLGIQYVEPNSRVLAVIAALVVFGTAWRLDMLSVLGLLVLTLPFPRSLTIANTNFALILLVLIIWLLRVTQRASPGFQRSALDVPILSFLIVWIVSFYNVHNQADLQIAVWNTLLLVGCILLFVLVQGIVRTERDLIRFHQFQIASLVSMIFMVLFEITHPGAKLVPGWLEFPSTVEDFGLHNMRVTGPFFDYELLAEFTAINLLLVGFLLARARKPLARLLLGILLAFTTFMLFATVTRGAMFSLGAALLYLTWLVRRRLRLVPFVLLVSAGTAGFLAMNFFVANFTRSGDILTRLMGTEFKGLVPDDRGDAWRDGWDQWMLNPLLGQGPCYHAQIGARLFYWPHNGYLLIASMVGALGLGAFLWMLWTLWRQTRPIVDSVEAPSYAQGFLVIAQTQLVLFAVDQLKIDFMRNKIYPFQVWLLFASWTVAARIARSRPTPSKAPA